MDIGSRIHELRINRGLTVKEVASRVGVSAAFISSVEHHASNVSFEKLEIICRVLDVTMAEFFKEDTLPTDQEFADRIKTLNSDQRRALYHFLVTIT